MSLANFNQHLLSYLSAVSFRRKRKLFSSFLFVCQRKKMRENDDSHTVVLSLSFGSMWHFSGMLKHVCSTVYPCLVVGLVDHQWRDWVKWQNPLPAFGPLSGESTCWPHLVWFLFVLHSVGPFHTWEQEELLANEMWRMQRQTWPIWRSTFWWQCWSQGWGCCSWGRQQRIHSVSGLSIPLFQVKVNHGDILKYSSGTKSKVRCLDIYYCDGWALLAYVFLVCCP